MELQEKKKFRVYFFDEDGIVFYRDSFGADSQDAVFKAALEDRKAGGGYLTLDRVLELRG